MNQTSETPEQLRLALLKMQESLDKLQYELILSKKENDNIQTKYNQLIESSPVGMVIVDSNGIVLSVNKKFTEITGYQYIDVQSTQEWWKLAYPDEDYRKKIYEAWTKSMKDYEGKGLKSFEPREARVKCKDGSDKFIEISFVSTDQYDAVTFVDVTERRLALNELSAHKDYTESILNSIPDIMFIMDSEGFIHEFKSGKEEDLAMPPEVFLHKNVSDILPPALAEDFLKEIRNVIKGGEVNPVQYQLPIEGVMKDFEARFNRFGDQKVVVLVSNNSLQKQTENALRESEERLRNLISSQTNYVLWTDLNGRHTYWNKKFEKEFGWMYANDGLAGADALNSICNYHHNRTRETVEKCLFNPGTIFKIELDKPAKDGGVRTTFWEFVCLTDAQNAPHAIQCMGIDITDQKKIERKLEENHQFLSDIIENSGSQIYVKDLNGVYLTVNGMWEKVTGASREMTIGKTDEDIFGPEVSQKFRANDLKVISTGESNTFEEDFTDEGGTRYFLSIKFPTRDSFGKITGLCGMSTEITDRKKAEIQLFHSEAKYRSLIDSSDSAITMLDTDGNYLFLNAIAAAPWGMPADQLVGMNASQLFPPDQFESIMKDIHSVISENAGKIKEVFVDITGERRWYRTSIQPVRNETGEPFAALMYSSNITETKLAEEKIRQSEQNYKTLFFDSPDGYLIIQDGIFIECNKASEAMIGGNSSIILGKSPDQLSPEFQPNGRKSSEYALELIAETYSKGHNSFEWVHCRFDGTEFLTQIDLTVMEYKGNQVLFTTWQDITESRKAEESNRKLSRAVEQSPVSIVITNIDGNIEYANPQACETTGYSLSELLGKNPRVLKSGETSSDEYSYLWNNISNGKEWKGIFHNKRKNGELYWESSTIAPIVDVNGKISHYVAIKEDITQRKLAEEELSKFRTISEQANYGNAIASLNGTLLYSNTAFAKMHGYEVDEIVGRNLSMLHNEEQMIRVSETIEILQKKGNFNAEEVWRTRKDGSVFPSLMNGNLIFDSQDRPQFMSANTIDITEIKLAEEKIREQNIRLNAIMDAMPDIIFISDKEGNYLEAYTSKTSTTKIKASANIGRNVRDVFDSQTADIHLNKIKECLSTRQMVTYEYPKDEDGEQHFYEARIVALDDKKVLRFVRDITERKQNESEIRKLTLAIEQSPVAIAITDLDANILYVSPAFYNTTGYTADEVIGKNTRILKSGLTDSAIYDSLWETLRAGNSWQGEWINKKKSGELYWESISITPVLNEEGQITSYLAVKQDISDRKKQEQEIRDLNMNLEIRIEERTKDLENSNLELDKARIDAEQANMAKSEFLSRMSHELRTPMNSILGFGQLLEMGDLNTAQVKGVSHIMKSGKHLLELINEVLDISRIESGRISLSLEPVELQGVIRETVDIVQPLASARQIKIKLTGENLNFLHVKSDRQRLKQVLLNIVNNAVKYNTDLGSVIIHTSIVEGKEAGKDIIRIAVSDTGPGITKEDLPKIFTPFERIGAEKTTTEGTGLGLAVVKKLMDAMHGGLGVESEYGNGSTFWIELPRIESQKEMAEKNGDFAAQSKEEINRAGTILYIEDNVSNIELVEQILMYQRSNIRLISDMVGKNTVKKAIEYSPDLILLDLNLPDIHGSEVLQQLQADEKTRSIPVVVLSADAMPTQLSRLMKMGACDYLTKPLDVPTFLKVIDQFILPS
ncbi:MAG: PAS domain S-box protein [Bacteroidales bacterium]